jgi:hypothetical protein
MSITLGGTNPAVTFPDATVQNTAVVAPSVIGQIPFSTDGSTYTPIAKVASGTAVASTSGTSITFSSMPSWVKRITVMFQGVSTNGTSLVQVQIGSGSTTTTGYVSIGGDFAIAGGVGGSTATTGFVIGDNLASSIRHGQMVITNITSNTWVSSHTIGSTGSNFIAVGGGSLALGGTLDRIVVTTVNGTDTFDAGSINILYE